MTDHVIENRPRTDPADSWAPKLVALDIDGTILDHDQRLTDRVRTSVRAVAELGTHVVIATGRSLHETLPVLDRLGLVNGWAVCSNGSVTLRLDPTLPEGYEVADTITFDPAEVLNLLREHLPTALFALETRAGEFLLTAPFPPGELEGPHTRVAGWEDLCVEQACRVVVRSPDHTSDEFLELTRSVGLHGVNYSVGWTAWLDLAPSGVSKASALDAIRDRLGVDADSTLAVGDGRNDIEMFGWAGQAVAMGNATDDVKVHADVVTGTVADDGLAEVLEKLLVR
ncbi:HAD family hydrolase [Kineosporia succinea]|uniref:Hydroxymethylpyrimidine pyrophosphatase-like HAD family hydrolase n=1 Tax=Kineosporia succinea TaxID=84632 RepID=A0ABT9P0P8_9ACTN|nr:HAD family hydrolase [Kineosporia succinea]MDP9826253.1 hydroxymethylpyrimidine pyrophosphatase-like HAD family hydrolase [Kineosporia succinea]